MEEQVTIKKWPILAQIIIAFGVGGGIISAWAGIVEKSVVVAAVGLLISALFWFFYQLKPWARWGVNILLVLLTVADMITIIKGLVRPEMGAFYIIFRGLILYYLNTPKIKSLFE